MSEDKVTTEAFMNRLINNLKSELEENLEKKLDEKCNPIKNDVEALKEKNMALERKIAAQEKKARINNLVIHGVEDNNDNYKVLRDKIVDIFEHIPNLEENDIDFRMSVVFTKTLGREVGNRPVLVKFVNPIAKSRMYEWKDELKQMGITIANDYTKQERE